MHLAKTSLTLSLATLAFLAGQATSTPQDDAKGMEAAWDEIPKPGKMHKLLDTFVGTWKADCSFWMMPGQEPMTTTGTMTDRWIMDGMYLEQEFEGDMMGNPFQGRGYMTYSNAYESYQSIWFDSMSSTIALAEGSVSDDGMTFTFHSEEKNPTTGEDMQVKDVLTVDGPKKHTFTRYVEGDEGDFKMMEIVYTKKG